MTIRELKAVKDGRYPRLDVLIVSRSATLEQLATAIDDAFARWDRNHLHESRSPTTR
jgi:hypothetical protein